MNRQTEFNSLLAAISSGNIDQLRLLLKNGADPNATDYISERTVLDMTTSYNQPEMMELLLEYGADPNMNNELYGAVFLKRINFVEMLLRHGANVNQINYMGRTVLHDAVRYNALDIAELLLDYGADPNIVDQKGNKPIDYVKTRRMAELLNRQYEDIKEPDSDY